MRTIIFKGQYGLYILAKNYKDKTDVAYINLYFAKCDEPVAQHTNDNGSQYAWVDLKEFTFNCYKGKVGLAVFNYEMAKSPKEDREAMENKVNEFIADNNLGGGHTSLNGQNISPEELPFY